MSSDVGDPPVAMLMCRAGNRNLAIAITDVIETMRPLPMDAIPGVPDYVAGVSLIRGQAVPVVDVATLLDGHRGTPGRFVTIRLGERIAALAVHSVAGIETVAAHVAPTLPPLLGDADAGIVAGLGQQDGALLLVLRNARLIPDSVWGTLAAGHAALPAQGRGHDQRRGQVTSP